MDALLLAEIDLFVKYLAADPVFFVSWFVTVVVSIMLHELAHGAAAIWRGDDTPLRSGHMSVNPLVHMGPWSLLALLIAGIAWGQMPIDHTRLRGRHAEATVGAAGPAANLLLAALGLTAIGLWKRFGLPPDTPFQQNAQQFLMIFGWANLVLCLFNLLPVPPLDGSHVLANFSRPYAIFIADPAHQGAVFLGFALAFVLLSTLIFNVAATAAAEYVGWLLSL